MEWAFRLFYSSERNADVRLEIQESSGRIFFFARVIDTTVMDGMRVLMRRLYFKVHSTSVSLHTQVGVLPHSFWLLVVMAAEILFSSQADQHFFHQPTSFDAHIQSRICSQEP